MLEVLRVNFQRSITVFILFGSPSITLLSLSFLTDIISLTNLTVKKRAVAVFSNFSITEDLIPINVNSDLIFFEFLSSIADWLFCLRFYFFFKLIKLLIRKTTIDLILMASFPSKNIS